MSDLEESQRSAAAQLGLSLQDLIQSVTANYGENIMYCGMEQFSLNICVQDLSLLAPPLPLLLLRTAPRITREARDSVTRSSLHRRVQRVRELSLFCFSFSGSYFVVVFQFRFNSHFLFVSHNLIPIPVAATLGAAGGITGTGVGATPGRTAKLGEFSIILT